MLKEIKECTEIYEQKRMKLEENPTKHEFMNDLIVLTEQYKIQIRRILYENLY